MSVRQHISPPSCAPWPADTRWRSLPGAYVAERVAPYQRLGAIDELPKSLTGELLRRVLVERERAVR